MRRTKEREMKNYIVGNLYLVQVKGSATWHRCTKTFFFSWMLKTMSKCRCINSFFIFSPFYTLDLGDYNGIKRRNNFFTFKRKTKTRFCCRSSVIVWLRDFCYVIPNVYDWNQNVFELYI